MVSADESGPDWVDTVGWEDRGEDNTNIFQVTGTEKQVSLQLKAFQNTLKFLNNNGLLKISAIVWCVSPNLRHVRLGHETGDKLSINSLQDDTLQKQAEFIDQFCPKSIWENVIIICEFSKYIAQH